MSLQSTASRRCHPYADAAVRLYTARRSSVERTVRLSAIASPRLVASCGLRAAGRRRRRAANRGLVESSSRLAGRVDVGRGRGRSWDCSRIERHLGPSDCEGSWAAVRLNRRPWPDRLEGEPKADEGHGHSGTIMRAKSVRWASIHPCRAYGTIGGTATSDLDEMVMPAGWTRCWVRPIRGG